MMIDRGRQDQRDPLTGVATRDVMRRFVEAALDLAEPQGPSVVIFALGIDDLHGIAARQGSQQVDGVLLSVADRLRSGLRQHDMVGRLPDGFCVCLTEAFTAEARQAAARLQRLLEATPLPGLSGPTPIRCSVGLAFGRGPGSSAEDLILRAQAALAAAQEAGGSRIVIDL